MRRKPHPYYVFAMAAINKEVSRTVATLRTDEINMNLLYLLESRYIVIVAQMSNEIIFELYKK